MSSLIEKPTFLLGLLLLVLVAAALFFGTPNLPFVLHKLGQYQLKQFTCTLSCEKDKLSTLFLLLFVRYVMHTEVNA